MCAPVLCSEKRATVERLVVGAKLTFCAATVHLCRICGSPSYCGTAAHSSEQEETGLLYKDSRSHLVCSAEHQYSSAHLFCLCKNAEVLRALLLVLLPSVYLFGFHPLNKHHNGSPLGPVYPCHATWPRVKYSASTAIRESRVTDNTFSGR